MALDQVFEEEEARADFRSGRMSGCEAYERGIVDELGGEIGTEYHPPLKTKTCRYCGAAGLRWGHHNGGWRLFDRGELHECP